MPELLSTFRVMGLGVWIYGVFVRGRDVLPLDVLREFGLLYVSGVFLSQVSFWCFLAWECVSVAECVMRAQDVGVHFWEFGSLSVCVRVFVVSWSLFFAPEDL